MPYFSITWQQMIFFCSLLSKVWEKKILVFSSVFACYSFRLKHVSKWRFLSISPPCESVWSKQNPFFFFLLSLFFLSTVPLSSGCRWPFIVANRQSRAFTPQVNEWLSAVISPNTDYQMFGGGGFIQGTRLEYSWSPILTGPRRICNAIMSLSNKTN